MHYRKVAISGGTITVVSLLVLFIGLDPLIRFTLRDQIGLRKRNLIRKIYLDIPFPLHFNVYFFNITNPTEVEKYGAKPVLKEIGPYRYLEHAKKISVTDNEAEDSLTYQPYHTFVFDSEASGKLSDTDYVTILNPLVVGLVSGLASVSVSFLSMANDVIFHLFNNPQSIYLTARVKDILFDGIEINCSSPVAVAAIACSQLKSRIPDIKNGNGKNIYLFSVFGGINATARKPIKVSRGIKNYKDVGKVLEFDGKKELNLWSSRKCNQFKGTDGWIVPPMLNPEEDVWVFYADLCRNVHGHCTNENVVKGIKVHQYGASLGDLSRNEDEKCYCPTPKTCMKKGVVDLTKCVGVPVYGTFPHFYDADPEFLQQVEGLNPVKEKHEILIMLEPLSSAPLRVGKRAQVNLKLAPTQRVHLMKYVPEVLHPVLWIDEGFELDGIYFSIIQAAVISLKLVKFLRWIVLIVGLTVTGYGAYLYLMNKDDVFSNRISPQNGKPEKEIELDYELKMDKNG